MRHSFRIGLTAAAALLGLASSRSALAGDCASLPNPVYVAGSTAAKPFLTAIGTALSAAATPITIVYQGQGSCTGVDAIVNATPVMGTGTYWSSTMTGDQSCDLSLTGDTADIGLSDVYPDSCANEAPGADVGQFLGPIQVMNFVVPKASTQTNISAEAAYFIFGFGPAAGQVAPWTTDTLAFVRGPTSGTEIMLGVAIDVPASKWKGVSESKSSDVITGVTTSTTPESTIGILSSGDADNNVATLTTLAYQHYGQTCGFTADSKAGAFDKKNVRDGHYPVWGPLHMLAKVDGSGAPTSAGAASVIGILDGSVDAPAGVDLISIETKAHVIPACAMEVSRTTEVGPLMSLQPAEPCGCYFDSIATGSSTCAACSADGDCTDANHSHCRHGFCEAN